MVPKLIKGRKFFKMKTKDNQAKNQPSIKDIFTKLKEKVEHSPKTINDLEVSHLYNKRKGDTLN